MGMGAPRDGGRGNWTSPPDRLTGLKSGRDQARGAGRERAVSAKSSGSRVWCTPRWLVLCFEDLYRRPKEVVVVLAFKSQEKGVLYPSLNLWFWYNHNQRKTNPLRPFDMYFFFRCFRAKPEQVTPHAPAQGVCDDSCALQPAPG